MLHVQVKFIPFCTQKRERMRAVFIYHQIPLECVLKCFFRAHTTVTTHQTFNMGCETFLMRPKKRARVQIQHLKINTKYFEVDLVWFRSACDLQTLIWKKTCFVVCRQRVRVCIESYWDLKTSNLQKLN